MVEDMVEASLNMFDLIVLGIVGISALVGVLRGFLREVLSLGSWFVAMIITISTFTEVRALVEPHIQSQAVAGAVTALGTFVVTLISLSIISGIFIRYLKSSTDLGFFDNGLGLVFGVVRGLLAVALGYYVMSIMLCEKDYPEWVQTAYTKDFIEDMAIFAAERSAGLLDEGITSCDADGNTVMEETPEFLRELGVPDVNAPASAPPAEGEEWMSIEELQKLMEQRGQ